MGDFGKLNFSVSFNRTSAFPIEANGYFESLEAAQAAAATAVEVGSAESTYYIGETLTVVEGDASTTYIILPDKSLKEVGNGVGMIDESSDGTGEIFNSYTHSYGIMPNIASGSFSHAEGENNTASGYAAHAEGRGTVAKGSNSHAEGHSTLANENFSHSEGENTRAIGQSSHAEGINADAIGKGSHAEGIYSVANGEASHAEGRGTSTTTDYAHAEGWSTRANGLAAHSEGGTTLANDLFSHAEGKDTIADGSASHAEGKSTHALGDDSHAEGYGSDSIGIASHAEGYFCITNSDYSHAEGNSTTVSGKAAHAEGIGTKAIGDYSHAEGGYNKAAGNCSHVEGRDNKANGNFSHSEGNLTEAAADYSHAEGYETIATGLTSHVEGKYSKSIGDLSHAEGYQTLAIGNYSHAEGGGAVPVDSSFYTKSNDEIIEEWNRLYNTPTIYETGDGFSMAKGKGSHVEGKNNLALGDYSHAESCLNIATGDKSHVEGSVNIVSGTSSHAEGWSNINYGNNSHTEGARNITVGGLSHAEGYITVADGNLAHTEGQGTETEIAINISAVSGSTFTSDINFSVNDILYFKSENLVYLVTGATSGGVTTVNKLVTLSTGSKTVYKRTAGAIADNSHSEGLNTKSIGNLSHSEGNNTIASGSSSHTEGTDTVASGLNTHAEGNDTLSSGENSHAEGNLSEATGLGTHAEGWGTVASGQYSHAEGKNCLSSGNYSHAEGGGSIASGAYSHSGGANSVSEGYASFAHGNGVKTKNNAEAAFGKFNVVNEGDASGKQSLYTVGCGTGDSSRSNAFLITLSGEAYFKDIGGYLGNLQFSYDTGGVIKEAKSLQRIISSLNLGVIDATYDISTLNTKIGNLLTLITKNTIYYITYSELTSITMPRDKFLSLYNAVNSGRVVFIDYETNYTKEPCSASIRNASGNYIVSIVEKRLLVNGSNKELRENTYTINGGTSLGASDATISRSYNIFTLLKGGDGVKYLNNLGAYTNPFPYKILTQDLYDSLSSKDSNTIYFIKE